MTYDAFISYRRNGGAELAEFLHNRLIHSGVPTFLDKEELHFGDFRKQLIQNNFNSRVLILLLSPGALDRCNEPGDWVNTEASLFLKLHKKIIVIKYKGFEFPDDLSKKLKKLKNVEQIEYDQYSTDHDEDYVANKLVQFLIGDWDICEDKDYITLALYNEDNNFDLTRSYKILTIDKTKDKLINYFWFNVIFIPLFVLLYLYGAEYHLVLVPCFFCLHIFVKYIEKNYDNLTNEKNNYTIATYFSLFGLLIKSVFIVLGIIIALVLLYYLLSETQFNAILPDETMFATIVSFPFSLVSITLSVNLLLKLFIYLPMFLNAVLSKYHCPMCHRQSKIKKIEENSKTNKLIMTIGIALALAIEITYATLLW